MKRKYNNEELSRILSAAAVSDGLKKSGEPGTGLPCCMVQAVELVYHSSSALFKDYEGACWFDFSSSARQAYNDPDLMLQALENKGWA